MHTPYDPRRRGMAMILSLILLTLTLSLSVAFLTTSNMELRKSDNLRSAANARLAAESGLGYTLWLLDDCRSESLSSGKPDMLAVVHAHLAERLAGSAYEVAFVGQNLDPEDPQAQRYITLSGGASGGVDLGDGKRFSTTIYVADVGVPVGEEVEGEDPAETIRLAVEVTGEAGGFTRTIGMQFGVHVDKSILHYAIASAPRVIIRGKANINGDICTGWKRIQGYGSSIAWPIDVGSPSASERANEDIQISGRVATTLSENRFDGTIDWTDPTWDPYEDTVFTHDSWDAVRHENIAQKISFDEPDLVNTIGPEDFDTSMYRDRANQYVLHSPKSSWGDSWQYEWFSNVRIYRANYANYNGSGSKPAFENLKIPKGKQAHFKNCTFKGITYIETDESTSGKPSRGNANNIVFEDCTFEGPIVTGVAKRFAWERNALQFIGNTTFRSSMIQETLAGTTILAPNFNINIGDFNQGAVGGDSKIVGILVGGIVDIRDNATVEGTILSMANLDYLSASQCYLYGSNVGNWEGGGETSGPGGGVATSTISITPNPNNVLPLGIKRKYILRVKPDSYIER